MESQKNTAFQCFYCKKCFTRASNRSRHMKTNHNKNSRGEQVPVTKFMCALCDKAYKTKYGLQYHLDSVHLLKNKMFKCDRPNCSYKSYLKGILNRHILKGHRPKPNYTEKQKIKCGKCQSTFISRTTLRRHETKIHKIIHPSNIKRKCPLCPYHSTTKNKKEIIVHFEKYHNLNTSPERYSFEDLEKFNEWKDQLQTNTSATFVKVSSKNQRSLHFICSRRGYFKTKGHNIRHIKMSGSCKINAYCPCEINAKINENGSVSVVYYPTHVGHKNDLKLRRLPAADKKVIISQLLPKTPHEEIFKRVCRSMKNECVATTQNSEELIMDVEGDFNKINIQHAVFMEIMNSSQSNDMSKDYLEILWKQLLEAISTNEEISFVKKTLKETIATVNAMKTTANRPLVSTTQMKKSGRIEHQKRFYSLKKSSKPKAKFNNEERNQIALDLLQNYT